jgi:hypothetical protein
LPTIDESMKTLIVCDVQPDVVQKLDQPRQFVDLIHTCIAAARQKQQQRPEPIQIVHTLLYFPDRSGGEEGQEELGRYAEISPTHPRLGILRKLGASNPNLTWFASTDLCVKPLDHELILTRSTFLPHANDTALLQGLRRSIIDTTGDTAEVTVIGYGPTVQALCSLLGDVLAVPNVQILRECVRDETTARCEAFLNHGLLFHEQVVSLVDYLESLDLLHERIDTPSTQRTAPSSGTPVKYVVDCGRGGHLSLFLPYLLKEHGYCLWPKQPWYKESSVTTSNKQYYCPLGRSLVELCDEPQFGYGTKFFLAGRQHLDEKNLLYDLVPELLPPTFGTVEAAQRYAQQHHQQQPDDANLVWFLKKVNQNGGRAITITNELPRQPLARDDQLQVHIPRPLLYHENHECQGQFKCHVKTYLYLACNNGLTLSAVTDPNVATASPSTTTAAANDVKWILYLYDCFYLATANSPWSTRDLSDDAQITTIRTHRLYADHPWRVRWNLTDRIRAHLTTVVQRAVVQGTLQSHHATVAASAQAATATVPPPDASSSCSAAALQFEVFSADWMLDEDGKIYLIEINGTPVLFDAEMPQDLSTKGLRLYDRLYRADPHGAVVNDHDLLREAIGLALTARLPATSLWKHVTTIVPPVS